MTDCVQVRFSVSATDKAAWQQLWAGLQKGQGGAVLQDRLDAICPGSGDLLDPLLSTLGANILIPEECRWQKNQVRVLLLCGCEGRRVQSTLRDLLSFMQVEELVVSVNGDDAS